MNWNSITGEGMVWLMMMIFIIIGALSQFYFAWRDRNDPRDDGNGKY